MRPTLHGWPDDPYVHVDLGLEIKKDGITYCMYLAGAFPEMSVFSDSPKVVREKKVYGWSVVHSAHLAQWSSDLENAKYVDVHPVFSVFTESQESADAYRELAATRDTILGFITIPPACSRCKCTMSGGRLPRKCLRCNQGYIHMKTSGKDEKIDCYCDTQGCKGDVV